MHELDQSFLIRERRRDLEAPAPAQDEAGPGPVDADLLAVGVDEVLGQRSERRHGSEDPAPEGCRVLRLGGQTGQPVLFSDDPADHLVDPVLVRQADACGGAVAEPPGELELDRGPDTLLQL